MPGVWIPSLLLLEQCLELRLGLFRRRRLAGGGLAAAEQRFELGLGGGGRILVAWRIGSGPWSKIVAKVRPLLVFDFLGNGLATLLGDADAIELAQLADVQ